MAEPARPSRRDPSARGRLSGLILTLVVLWPMLQTSGFSLKPLFDADNLKVIGGFRAVSAARRPVGSFWPTWLRPRWRPWPSPRPAWRWPL
jgi:phosphonate transport system permease protein